MNTAAFHEPPVLARRHDDLPHEASIFRFRLYISGDTPNSAEALRNLHAICARHLHGKCAIEVIDVFREPARALEAGVFMTPTLVRHAPGKVKRIIGTLAQEQRVLLELGITPAVA